jgi:hypothetical protein
MGMGNVNSQNLDSGDAHDPHSSSSVWERAYRQDVNMDTPLDDENDTSMDQTHVRLFKCSKY